ncbi:hypothetical protein BRADI_3g40265v3 [Brachypodium distachyon]|uniref:Uncharacterized protein n=1 Tax=Brachypodium distachyon TaxID=15368 RepID=A0A0Q3IEI0_BRADI|nr:hypothetical protein BRADI_3g40265v3 [Brachypodium distachyon]
MFSQYFCGSLVTYLFLGISRWLGWRLSVACGALWKLCNKACFEHKLIRSPAEIVCYTCAFLCYWAGLQNEVERTNLLAGAATLQSEALRHHEAQARTDKRKLTGGSEDADTGGAQNNKKEDDAKD